VPKSLSLPLPQTGLPKTLDSGFVEILIDHVPSRRIVLPKSLFSIWVNQLLPLQSFSQPCLWQGRIKRRAYNGNLHASVRHYKISANVILDLVEKYSNL